MPYCQLLFTVSLIPCEHSITLWSAVPSVLWSCQLAPSVGRQPTVVQGAVCLPLSQLQWLSAFSTHWAQYGLHCIPTLQYSEPNQMKATVHCILIKLYHKPTVMLNQQTFLKNAEGCTTAWPRAVAAADTISGSFQMKMGGTKCWPWGKPANEVLASLEGRGLLPPSSLIMHLLWRPAGRQRQGSGCGPLEVKTQREPCCKRKATKWRHLTSILKAWTCNCSPWHRNSAVSPKTSPSLKGQLYA